MTDEALRARIMAGHQERLRYARYGVLTFYKETVIAGASPPYKPAVIFIVEGGSAVGRAEFHNYEDGEAYWFKRCREKAVELALWTLGVRND